MSTAPATENTSQKLILVVEDDSLLRESLSLGLQDRGYHVIDAATVDEAITRVVTCGRRVDLLFTDVDLAGALDGIDLALWFALYAPKAPIILTSGKVSPKPRDSRLFEKPVDFFEKPVDDAALHRRIEALLLRPA